MCQERRTRGSIEARHVEARTYLTYLKNVAHGDPSKNANESGKPTSEGWHVRLTFEPFGSQ